MYNTSIAVMKKANKYDPLEENHICSSFFSSYTECLDSKYSFSSCIFLHEITLNELLNTSSMCVINIFSSFALSSDLSFIFIRT